MHITRESPSLSKKIRTDYKMSSIIFSSYGLILHDDVEEILCLRVTDGLELGVVIRTMVEIEESMVQGPVPIVLSS